MQPLRLAQLIASKANELGFDLVGVTPVGPSPDYARFQQWLAAGHHGAMAYLAQRAAERGDPRLLLPEARSLILLGTTYFDQTLPDDWRQDPSRGLIAAYAWGEDYHEVLKARLFELDATLAAASGRTSRGRAFVDSGPLLERSWAARAGLGFIGKNTCLIAPRLGSWLFLAGLLVPEEVASGPWQATEGPASSPAAAPYPLTCGACTRCLDACPTAAFVAPHVLDARRCISYLTIELRGPVPRALRPLMANWVFGCDVCQTVCPWNRRFARRGRLADFRGREDTMAPKLLDLLALDEAGFRRRFRRSPVLRAKRRGLLRNVCIALGNWGDPQAVPGLCEALHDAEPLIRGHAAWALGRIDTAPARRALAQRQAVETEPYVVEELLGALSRQFPPPADLP